MRGLLLLPAALQLILKKSRKQGSQTFFPNGSYILKKEMATHAVLFTNFNLRAEKYKLCSLSVFPVTAHEKLSKMI